MRIALVAMLALALAACGSKTEEAVPAKKHTAAAATHPPADDEVAAVLESTGTALAQLRFVIAERPVVGKPFNLKLIVSATAPLPQLLLTAESNDFLIDPANFPLPLTEAEAASGGREYRGSHDFSVTAAKEGLAELSVHLTVGPDASEALYVIPVLVVKPAAPASDKPDPAAAGNHG